MLMLDTPGNKAPYNNFVPVHEQSTCPDPTESIHFLTLTYTGTIRGL